MYHQQQQQLQQGHKQHRLSSRPIISSPPEKQFLVQGGGDSGLILSTDAKPRLKWTPELHERFVEAVNQLGGPEKATPKTIMRLMGIPGLTLYHLKSHLQKYRLSKNLQAQANAVHAKNASGCRTATDKICEGDGSPAASHFTSEPQLISSRSMHISEALQMQIEVQRRLHEQLEVQRHLQLRIEAQGKYLQSVLEKAALARQSVTDVDALRLEDKAPELLASTTRRRHGAGGDGSADSCLTACEGSQSQSQFKRDDRDMLSIGLCTTAPKTAGRASSSSQFMFLIDDDEPGGGGASPEYDRKTSIISDTTSTSSRRRRPPDCGAKIDLNASSWD